MNLTTKKLCVLGMLSAVAFLLALLARTMPPIVLFLRHDPKDVIITIGGFFYGPVAALSITLVVSVLQFFSGSATGVWGLVMNIISSASFCCTAAYIYHRRRSLKNAAIGLAVAIVVTTVVMVAWNYLILPLYMERVSRADAAGLLIPAIIPFNLLKGGLNAAFTMILYKPIKKALQAAKVMPQAEEPSKARINIWAIIVSIFVIITCSLWIMMLQGIFGGV